MDATFNSFKNRAKTSEGMVHGWRVDGPEKNSLAFDNMCERRIKGTNGWSKYNIVLNVPIEATNIAFGIMLGGKGQVWLDDVSFEVVDENVAVTDCKCMARNGKPASNLNFEEE